MRLLLLEDDTRLATLVERVARSLGASIERHATATTGLGRLSEQNFDLVIVDQVLPDKSGVRVVEHIKTGPAPHPRIVLLSDLIDDLRSFRELEALGVDKVLHKPLSAHELRTELSPLLSASPPAPQPHRPEVEAFVEEGLDLATVLELGALLDRAERGSSEIVDAVHGFCHSLATSALAQEQHAVAAAAAHLVQRIEDGDRDTLVPDMKRLLALLSNAHAEGDVAEYASTLAARFEHVLVVSSAPEVRERLTEQLATLGVQSSCVSSVPEALEAVIDAAPDLLLVDAETTSADDAHLSPPRPAALTLSMRVPSIPLVALGVAPTPLPLHLRSCPLPTHADMLAEVLADPTLQPFAGSSLLVCSDTPRTAAQVRALCKPLGVSVHVVTELSDYLAALIEHDPSLVLMSMDLHVLNGIERCRLTKSNPATRDIPILFLSARTSARDRRLAYQAGAAGYVLEPIVGEELGAEIKRLLRRERSARLALTLTRQQFDRGEPDPMLDEGTPNLPWFGGVYRH
ncbi:response regulator [Haliangium sp.]|uniref:response regulator n=1 Tax=Haliangium sp. TaxID=2663208 RepID=UPI003D13AF32